MGDWRRLVQIQEIKLTETIDDSERIASMLRIAQIREEQLEDAGLDCSSVARTLRSYLGAGTRKV